jgi:hypothetical protein
MGADRATLKIEELLQNLNTHPIDKLRQERIAESMREFHNKWFLPTLVNIEAAVALLPEPLEAMGGTLADAVQTLVVRLQGAESEAERLRKANKPAKPGPVLAEDPRDLVLVLVRNVIRKWESGGVGNAIATAPARLAEINEVIREHLYTPAEEVPSRAGDGAGV